MNFTGTSGNNHFTGTGSADTFHMGQGGNDHVSGEGSNDTFDFGATLTIADRIDGGAGSDVLNLDGGGGIDDIEIGAHTLTGVEKLDLAAGSRYALTFDATPGLHEHITVDASAATAFEINAKSDATRTFTIIGSANGDDIVGSPGNHTIIGGPGADGISGVGGHDTFEYQHVSDSTGSVFDDLSFDRQKDVFDMSVSVTGVDHVVRHGTIDFGANFNSELESDIGAGKLAAHHAVVFIPSGGNLQTFLIVDANGDPGYQANEDYVIGIFGSDLAHINLSNFTT